MLEGRYKRSIHFVCENLIAAAGNTRVYELTSNHVREAAGEYARLAPITRHNRASCLRRLLRHLHAECGAPDLAASVPRQYKPPPRNVTATDEERRLILGAAKPHLRMFLLLCSDLAIRSGTALRIAPIHYDKEREEITFKTKYSESLTLPVTAELSALMKLHRREATVPYVSALHPNGQVADRNVREQFTRLRRSLGITKNFTPHDLRRTTAVATYAITKDLRMVQALLGHRDLSSTLHYLDHHNTPVNLETLELAKLNADALELAKLNPTTEVIQ